MDDTQILPQLRQALKRAGPAAWPQIAAMTGQSVHGLRKLAYGDRKNPSLKTVQSLLEYFGAAAKASAA
jgi:hypothetical protein